jgi:hypothetical protein
MAGFRNHASIPGNATTAFTLLGCLMTSLCLSQKITNVDFDVVGSTVQIRYDIDDCATDKTYDLRVYVGKNGEMTEIRRGLSGDVEGVACGASKAITWDVLSDREELAGRVYFAVEIYRAHPVITKDPVSAENQKPRSRRSWKADKGYVGGSMGIYTPYEANTNVPQNLTRGGVFANASLGYLPSLLLGVSSTVYIYSDTRRNQFDLSTWKNWGVMIGPLISLPIGNVIKWEFRPQIGYAVTIESTDIARPDSLDVFRSGVAFSMGSGLRLNIGKRTCYILNVEYVTAPIRFDDYPLEAKLGTLGASFGIAFRFY